MDTTTPPSSVSVSTRTRLGATAHTTCTWSAKMGASSRAIGGALQLHGDEPGFVARRGIGTDDVGRRRGRSVEQLVDVQLVTAVPYRPHRLDTGWCDAVLAFGEVQQVRVAGYLRPRIRGSKLGLRAAPFADFDNLARSDGGEDGQLVLECVHGVLRMAPRRAAKSD